MKNFYENDETLPQSSRGVIVKRLIKHFPDRDFDNDEELFEERQLKSKIEVEDKGSKIKIGKWFLAGFIVAIFIILFIRIKLFL